MDAASVTPTRSMEEGLKQDAALERRGRPGANGGAEPCPSHLMDEEGRLGLVEDHRLGQHQRGRGHERVGRREIRRRQVAHYARLATGRVDLRPSRRPCLILPLRRSSCRCMAAVGFRPLHVGAPGVGVARHQHRADQHHARDHREQGAGPAAGQLMEVRMDHEYLPISYRLDGAWRKARLRQIVAGRDPFGGPSAT